MLALYHLGSVDARMIEAVQAGSRWLAGLQNRDGGIPTFCRGWGTLPFDRSSPDITAHALQAWLVWKDQLPEVDAAMARAVAFLKKVQRADGAWIPLWFGNQYALNDENPLYGTARVVAAMKLFPGAREATRRGVEWILKAQNADGGWGGDRGLESSIEETALAVTALGGEAEAIASWERGVGWLAAATWEGAETPPSPIGFYFARLWYYEGLYPLVFATATAK